jgi:hypothetical protein
VKTQSRMALQKHLVSLCLLAVLGALSGCLSGHPAAVDRTSGDVLGHDAVMVCDLLYFGLSTRQGEVSDSEWQAFLQGIVTPRLPKGFSTWDANGQWQGEQGVIMCEHAKVLQVIHPDSREFDVAIQEIVALYKHMFEQESVMRVRSMVRVSF